MWFNSRLEIQSQEISLDTESYKIQSYFLEDFTNKYRNIICKLAGEQSEKLIFDNLFKVLSTENSHSKQIYESLYSTVRIQQTNVKININNSVKWNEAKFRNHGRT
jgi:thymidylate synthase